jgi:glycerol 3-phosphatase-2
MTLAVGLQASAAELCTEYDVALLDLDGVVYVGSAAVPAAPSALEQARDRGMRLAFVTNNAARPPAVVAAHLTELGIPAGAGDVITSAQAAAHYLADLLPPGARVLVIGTVGLVEALHDRGLQAVHTADDQPAAVVQGYSPDLDWRLLAEGAIAIRRGLPWVATNLDPTVPSPRGALPGNGSLVAALRLATGLEPIAATGKPDPTMHRETVERTGARRPLIVGDRLDTDIEGAVRAGCQSLLVLSGVTSPRDLLAAGPHERPTYLGYDVGALLESHRGPSAGPDGMSCGGWHVSADLTLSAPGPDPDRGAVRDDLDALRALCAAAWHASSGSTQPSPRAADEWAAALLARFELG